MKMAYLGYPQTRERLPVLPVRANQRSATVSLSNDTRIGYDGPFLMYVKGRGSIPQHTGGRYQDCRMAAPFFP